MWSLGPHEWDLGWGEEILMGFGVFVLNNIRWGFGVGGFGVKSMGFGAFGLQNISLGFGAMIHAGFGAT